MNRADLDLLLDRCASRLACEVDQSSRDLMSEIATARARLATDCVAAVALRALVDFSMEGRHMSRSDDAAVIGAWKRADDALAGPCTPTHDKSADCVFRQHVIEAAQHWVNGRPSYQPKSGEVIEVWRPRVRPDGQMLPTLSERALDVAFAIAELRTAFPTDEQQHAGGRPPAEHLKAHLVVAADNLEKLSDALKTLGL